MVAISYVLMQELTVVVHASDKPIGLGAVLGSQRAALHGLFAKEVSRRLPTQPARRLEHLIEILLPIIDNSGVKHEH